ncbi:MAG: hypothetical protein K0U79_03100 [Gammaproteobacteria bacterium]|nr:hypothetical protein [Gammaproteobacteria bacterium]
MLCAGFMMVPSWCGAQAERDSKGLDFWLGFPFGYDDDDPTEYSLFISGDEATIANVEIPGLGFTESVPVEPGTAVRVPLPAAVDLPESDEVVERGIRVRADREISVYGLSQEVFTTDAYLGLPDDALGTDYIVVGYSDSNASETDISESQYLIVGSVDNTLVEIEASPLDPCGDDVRIMLNAGQVYRHRSCGTGDVSGTQISADQPVAVYGGHECANIPTSQYDFCDFIVEQLPSTEAWGSRFLTAPLATRMRGDTFRILAATDGTIVRLNDRQIAVLDRGEFVQTDIKGPGQIDATEPVLVVQYSNSTEYDGIVSDPFMMLVPPFEQFLDRYTFATPPQGFPVNFVNIVARTEEVGRLRLDGNLIDPDEFNVIPGEAYSYAQLEIEAGGHDLREGVAGIFVYGFSVDESYGYPGGYSLSPVAAVSQVVLSQESQAAIVDRAACVVAAVIDEDEGPLRDIRADFVITGVHPQLGSDRTDETGVAEYCWLGTEVGDDMVTASVGSYSDTTTVTWTDRSVLQLDAATFSVLENEGLFSVKVHRVGSARLAARVGFESVAGSAAADVDYAPVTGELAWEAGDLEDKSIEVRLIDDAYIESTETFGLRLTNADDAELGEIASASIEIEDNDRLTGVSLSALGESFYVKDQACVLASAYDGGQNDLGLAQLPIHFELRGVNPGGATVLTDDAGQAEFCWIGQITGEDTIIASAGDVEASATTRWKLGRIELASDRLLVDEGDVRASAQVIRVGGSGALSVRYLVRDGTAHGGTDFLESGGTLYWADGDDTPRTIEVLLLDDSVPEDQEDFSIVLTHPLGAVLGEKSEMAVSVQDNDDESLSDGGSTGSWGLAFMAVLALIRYRRLRLCRLYKKAPERRGRLRGCASGSISRGSRPGSTARFRRCCHRRRHCR